MGEAKRRGTFEERRLRAVQLKKERDAALEAENPLEAHMSKKRRQEILTVLAASSLIK